MVCVYVHVYVRMRVHAHEFSLYLYACIGLRFVCVGVHAGVRMGLWVCVSLYVSRLAWFI